MQSNPYKKNKTSLQQLYGRRNVTRTLCNEVKSDTKIPINPQIAKQNLQNLKVNLSKSPERLKSLRMLNTDLCRALGIDSNTASHYGGFVIDGFECSIRVSNHNSKANTYDIDLNNNISLKIRPRNDRNKFIPSETVTLEEFVYFDSMINQDKNLVLDIIDSLIGYLSTGEYIDESGLAKKNYSPDLKTISQQRVQQTLQRKDNEDYINLTHMGESKRYKNNQINCNKNMNRNRKNVVRLTETELRDMIKEAVTEVLYEVKIQNPETGEYEEMHGYYGQGGENRSKAANDWYKLAKIRHLKSRDALEQGDLESGIKQFDKAQRNSQNARDYEPYLNKHLGRM